VLSDWLTVEPEPMRPAVLQVVVMLSAEYGRMRIGRCVEDGLGFLGCSSNVLSLADRKCSGRQSCRISIPDKDFDSTRPCNKEVKVYLEASYVCKSGMCVPRRLCITDHFVLQAKNYSLLVK